MRPRSVDGDPIMDLRPLFLKVLMAGIRTFHKGSLEKRSDVALEWVYVDGSLHHVSDFAGIPSHTRPPVFCPLCSRLVIMKLGAKRAHHASHYPGDTCDASAPETAAHLNAKFHLVRELEKAGSLAIWQQCAGRKPGSDGGEISEACSSHRPLIIAAGWDKVRPDFALGPYKADVALMRGGQVILAIEISTSQPIGEGKKAHLRKQKVPWVEIDGKAEFYTGVSAWNSDRPLPILDLNPQFSQTWQCDECARKDQAAVHKEDRNKDHSRKSGEVKVVALRIADFFYPSGKQFREIFRMKKRISGENAGEMWLDRENWTTLERAGPGENRPQEILEAAFSRLIASQERRGVIIDSPMSWQAWPDGLRIKDVKHGDLFPPRYIRENGRWVLRIEHESLNWDERWQDAQPRPPAISSGQVIPGEGSRGVGREAASRQPDGPKRLIMDGNREKVEATCMFCQEKTTDWWYIDRAKGVCKCYKCLRDGKSSR